MTQSLNFDLSDEQKAVVRSNAPAISVVASAGSGKTEVIAHRLERLIRDSPHSHFRVLALSYTVKAASELGSRLRERLGAAYERIKTETIHGFAHSLIRQHGTKIGLPLDPEVIVRDEDRAELLAKYSSQKGQAVSSGLDGLLKDLDLKRAKGESSTRIDEWHRALMDLGAVDYPSMLVRAYEILQFRSTRRLLSRVYRHVIVDEAQNLTHAQYSLLCAVFGEPGTQHNGKVNTMLVGDAKQSIIGFAGADPELIRKFERQYKAKRFTLTKNFRSASKIVRLGNCVSRELNRSEPIQPVYGVSDYAAKGTILVKRTPDEASEGKMVASWALDLISNGLPNEAIPSGEQAKVRPEDIAILGRTGSALRWVAAALRDAGHEPAISSLPDDWLGSTVGKVAYEVAAYGNSRPHQSTKWQLTRLLDLSYDTSLEKPADLIAVLETRDDQGLTQLASLIEIDDPSKFVDGLAEIELDPESPELAAWEADSGLIADTWTSFERETSPLARTWSNFKFYASQRVRGSDLSPGIRLQTVHKAQGRGYRAVAIVGMNQGQFPDFRATSEKARRDELRAFYVAVTRARRALLLTRSEQRMTRYGPWQTEPSEFLELVTPD